MDDGDASSTSSEASVFDLEPVSGAVLLDQELRHRETCAASGAIHTGCSGLDEDVLIGGLERGRVVGVSSEEEGFGLLLGLQVIARLLVAAREDQGGGGENAGGGVRATARIITTLSNAELLPILRGVVKGQVDALTDGAGGDEKARMRAALEGISISRVFDFDGLRETLDELDSPIQIVEDRRVDGHPEERSGEKQLELEHVDQDEMEILDSDEDMGTPSSPSPHAEPFPQPSLSPVKRTAPQEPASNQALRPGQHYRIPDVVLITNMTALITSLYTTRDRRHAHRMIRNLSSRLRYLSRSAAHGAPLFMLLNSTTSKNVSAGNKPGQQLGQGNEHQPHDDVSGASSPMSSLSSSPPHSPSDQLPLNIKDPTVPIAPVSEHEQDQEDDFAVVRSVFNPPLPRPEDEEGEEDEWGYARHPDAEFRRKTRLARRNKPFFGLRFDGMVDLHLLASRVPRRDGDAEVFYSGIGLDGDGEVVTEGVERVWVVEVLGDRKGVWVVDEDGGDEEMENWDAGWGVVYGRRFNREQRWAGVEVRQERGGVRIVDTPG